MKIEKKHIGIVAGLVVLTGIFSFILINRNSSHEKMINTLKYLSEKHNSISNPFNPESKVAHCDSLLRLKEYSHDINLLLMKASLDLKVGKEQESVALYDSVLQKMDYMGLGGIMPDVAIAYMRLGERSNCMLNHTGASCIFPIKDGGIHQIKTGSQKAIDVYQGILKARPDDYESKWLLNIAYMTLGRYPKGVPREFLIPGLDADTIDKVRPFKDMAADLGLNVNGRAGGVIVDDFNNDGYLDIVTSGWDLDDPMHYFQNNKNGTFSDLTAQSGLTGINGGLNIQQTDYNNDGKLDIFVLRGAWNSQGFGNQPSSLLRNNGDGTFTDVTSSSGLLFFQPTQAATWADFNNDGWLDVFVGTENSGMDDKGGVHTSMLFMNNHDGTFTNVADKAHCDVTDFVKGVTSADYNHDGYPDIFVSTLTGEKYLLKNKGKQGAIPDFQNVTRAAGLMDNDEGTFTTWFYDYNNDGWPDIMVADYQFQTSLAWYAGAYAVGKPVPKAGNIFLYRNNHNGTFTNVTKQMGLDKVVYSMGANFGDIDNDGFPDMYFGTGNPDFKSLVPNKLFRNIEGKRYADVTTSSRMGNLQKGHGVAFADIRNNGIQDVFIEMGGAFAGDSYTSSLYVNPGQNGNNWISLKLEGTKANKAAIGSHIKLTFTENGVKRSVYKDVNSGGSFGSQPLRQELGIGQAKVIDDIEITWAGTNAVQHFTNVAPNQFLHITEGNNRAGIDHFEKLSYKSRPEKMMKMNMNASTPICK
ncbi:CRTAC1 family protein [Mucilaginibacter ginsenosidivorans]|uniref:CRTAC1 family protein n=1 Tax=Mucilaginibacter ginsenosidivorans TaxID=398053 RepID=UPI001652609A|nr:CRTAC1 family protein [Mucilaginibacter ginsenosidivorans]